HLVQFHLGGGPAVAHIVLDLDGLGGHIVRVGGDAQIGGDLADDVADHRGHDHRGKVLGPAGVVQHGEDQVFRVVDGQGRGKADLLVVVIVIAALGTVQLFAGARLAADGVPGHIAVAAGVAVLPLADVVFHHGTQLGADLFRDDLPADVGLGLLDHIAAVVVDAANHIRGEQ